MNRLGYFSLIAFLIFPLGVRAQTGKSHRLLSCGPLAGQLFRCPKYSFSYKIPFGWVDRTDYMQGDTPDTESGPSAGSAQSLPKSRTLLAVFERPPGAPGETINSAVVIAVESLADYPGVKTAADYFGPITDLAQKRGFKVENDPYEFRIGGRRLVRGDFSQQAGTLTMWQSTLVMIDRGEVVSFTFLSTTQDDVDNLIASLSFGAGRTVPLD